MFAAMAISCHFYFQKKLIFRCLTEKHTVNICLIITAAKTMFLLAEWEP